VFTVVSPSSRCSASSSGEAIIDVGTSETGSSSGGLLSSHVTELTGCGTADWPWLIEAGNGQRVNVTLYDFSREALATREPGTSPDRSSTDGGRTCKVYATIRDGSGSRSTTICGGRVPVSHVFLSTTGRVEIRLLQPASAKVNTKVNSMSPGVHMPHFVLRYQGTFSRPDSWVLRLWSVTVRVQRFQQYCSRARDQSSGLLHCEYNIHVVEFHCHSYFRICKFPVIIILCQKLMA